MQSSTKTKRTYIKKDRNKARLVKELNLAQLHCSITAQELAQVHNEYFC